MAGLRKSQLFCTAAPCQCTDFGEHVWVTFTLTINHLSRTGHGFPQSLSVQFWYKVAAKFPLELGPEKGPRKSYTSSNESIFWRGQTRLAGVFFHDPIHGLPKVACRSLYISKKKAARPPSKNQGHPEIDDLLNERRAPRAIQNAPEMTVRYMDKSGKMRCKGGADLKQSQHYPMRRLAWICSTCLRSFSLVQIG